MLRKIHLVIQTQLTQGLSVDACSRAVAMGITIAIFPILGFSTLMNTVAAAWFRLNQPVVHAFSWIMGPVKIALIFPFLRLGEFLFRAEPFTLSLAEFSERFFSDWLATGREFAWTFVHATVGWLLCAPILFALLYLLARPIIQRFEHRLPGQRSGIVSQEST